MFLNKVSNGTAFGFRKHTLASVIFVARLFTAATIAVFDNVVAGGTIAGPTSGVIPI